MNFERINPSAGSLVGLVLSALFLGLFGCSDEPETPSPPPYQPPAPPLLAPQAPPEIGALDSFGNLRVSEERILGFDLPAGSERNLRALAFPMVYVPSNARRLLRFYRSRGHVLIKTMTSWRIAHSPRTLREAGPEGASHPDAFILMSQGPGAGHTLRFHNASPQEASKRPVERLREAEREAAASKPGPKTQVTYAKKDRLRRLKREAFHKRPKTAKATDLSRRIYEHMQRTGSDRFRD